MKRGREEEKEREISGEGVAEIEPVESVWRPIGKSSSGGRRCPSDVRLRVEPVKTIVECTRGERVTVQSSVERVES